MADAPDPATLVEFRRLWKAASEVCLSQDEFLQLVFMAAVDLDRQRATKRLDSVAD